MSKELNTIEQNIAIVEETNLVEKLDDISLALIGGGEYVVSF
jgi:hypothetical protein